MSEAPLSETRFYTIAEAADILRLKEWAIRNHIKNGKLPATKPFGTWLIADHDLRRLIEAGAAGAA